MLSWKITRRCLTGVAVGLLAPEAGWAIVCPNKRPGRKNAGRQAAPAFLMHAPFFLESTLACVWVEEGGSRSMVSHISRKTNEMPGSGIKSGRRARLQPCREICE